MKAQTCHIHRHATEGRKDGVKVVAYVGSCGPHSFHVAKSTRSARETAIEEHLAEQKSLTS